MSETPQLATAGDPNAQLDAAADAFKAFVAPPIERPRDSQGRFLSEGGEEDPFRQILPDIPVDDDGEPEEEATEDNDDEEDAPEAAEEAQPEAVPLPSSWSKDDEGLWQSLPPEAQAKLAEREGQRDAAVNSKFQETANARKAAEAQLAEANANRNRYATAIDEVLSLVQVREPSPTEYGLGTEYYDRDSYDLAVYQYRQAQQTVESLKQQREQLSAQQAEENERVRAQAHAEIEATAWPKFLSEVPELADPTKGRQIIDETVRYAKQLGVPSQVFDDPESAKTLTSVELHIAWKAMQYDRLMQAGERVKATNPPPKPAAPAIRPGSVATRQSVQKTQLGKAQARLANDGTVESAAAVFRNISFR